MKTGPVQQALFIALTGNAPLMNSLSTAWGFDPVFDHVPQVPDPENGAYYPYVTIQDITAGQWDTDTSNGASVSVQIDVWSRSRSTMQVRDIADGLYDLLHYQPLLISGAHHVWTDVRSSQARTGADGLTRHAMLEARVVLDGI